MQSHTHTLHYVIVVISANAFMFGIKSLVMYEKRTNEFIGIFNCSRLSKDLKWSDMKYSRSLCVKKNVKPERSCCFSCWLVSKTRWLFVKLFTPLGGFGQRPHTTLILFNKGDLLVEKKLVYTQLPSPTFLIKVLHLIWSDPGYALVNMIMSRMWL